MRTLILSGIVLSLQGVALPSGLAQSADALQIERRSTYRPAAERTPFWPIGWSPTAAIEAPVVAQSDSDTSFFTPNRFNLSSISIGRLPLALINGRAYSEGDLVPINSEFSAEVVAVRDGEVELRFRNKTITIGLKAPATRQQQGGGSR